MLEKFDKPFRTSFGDNDPVTAGMETVLQDRVAGAKGIDHVTIEGAGHFLQEEQGELVAREMIDFIRST